MADNIEDHPELLAMWDAERNEQDPSSTLAYSYKTVWWECLKGHSFQRSPRMMLRDPACPTCRTGSSTFAAINSGLARLWHPEKNGNLRPDAIDAGHTDNVWWRCKEGHAFERAPIQMVHDATCPLCALAESSLAKRFPEIAREWHPQKNGEITPDQVKPDHVASVWWRCPRGHEFQQSVRKRTTGHGRCPICFGTWTIDTIRAFVKSLLGHTNVLTPPETFALAMQAGVLSHKDSRPFVMALTTGRFPTEELEKFVEGKPSLVDEFATKPELTLEMLEEEKDEAKVPSPDDPFALPDAPTGDADPNDVEIDVDRQIELTGKADEEQDLPVVQTHDALAVLDQVLVANADAETVNFLRDSAGAKLWRHAYLNAEKARAQAEAFQGDAYSTLVRDRFLADLNEAEGLTNAELNALGYRFKPKPGGPIEYPNLMQKHVAVSVRSRRRYGNWSGMGAGKTLSAILATRIVKAGLTIVCCPNAVVEGWEEEINNVFSGCDIATKTWDPQWRDPMATAPRYLILNYEQFQQPGSEDALVDFIGQNIVDFIVIDEIHFAKQRDANEMSKRKRLVQGLVLEAGKKNKELCVLGMSGTPVINELQEGKSLVELITGHKHDDLKTKATIQNCMRLYQSLVTLGTRYKPQYKTQLDESNRPEIDCTPHLDEIRRVGRGTVLELEQVLTRHRIPTILENIELGEKVLIYTHYVDGIADQLFEAIHRAKHHAGLFTGEDDDSALMSFLGRKRPAGKGRYPKVDVLIASSRISTGVDGLQHVCKKLIINCLPWTNAEYEQLRGRLWRQGSEFDKVEVIIPVTFATVNGQRWSYCESKLQRLHYKKSIADAAVDGVVPEGNLRTERQAQQDIMSWLTRLEGGELQEILRSEIQIPLSGEPSEVARRVAAYGDFTKMNNAWYATTSRKTHLRLAASREEWEHYHTMYREMRQSWTVVPYQEEIKWLSNPKRKGYVVGDFGCGEALIHAEVGDRCTVFSFDHVAVNRSVVACDVSDVPLEDETLDLAVFCLSLMGANFVDYLREAHRCLRLDKWLHIWEPASYFDDVDAFCTGLGDLGFRVMPPRKEGDFLFIEASKNDDTPRSKIKIPFRGRK